MKGLFSKWVIAGISGILGVIILSLGLVEVAHAESRLDMIRERGYLIAGCKDQTVPFGFRDNRGNIVGFDVDVCRYIADKLGVGLKIVPVTSATRIPLVENGTVDLSAASMTHNKVRDQVIDYSITFFFDGQKVMVKKASGIKDLEDLAGKKVSIVKGTTAERNILRVQPKVKIVYFDQQPEAFRALQNDIIDGIAIDSTQLLGLKAEAPNPDDYEIIGEFFSDEPLAIGVQENDSDWRDFVNESLIEMWNSGEWLRIYNKWFGPGTEYEFPLDFEMDTWPL